jgi:hypothetical protein
VAQFCGGVVGLVVLINGLQSRGVSYRARQLVALVLLVTVASAYGRISRDWSFGTFYPVLLG